MGSTPLRESLLNSHPPPPVSTLASLDEETSMRVINLTMGNNGGIPSPPPKISVVPKMELLQEDGEGERDRERDREREIIRGGSGEGSGSGNGEGGISDHEDELKEEDEMDNEVHHLNTTPHDLSGLPPHLTAAVQNFVPYAAAAAAAAAGSSQLDNYPGPSGVMPPASQPGWRGGPHSDSPDTSAQDYQLLQKLQFISASHQYMHWPSRRPAVCPGCGKFFKFKYNMKIHLKKCMNAQMSSQVMGGLSVERGDEMHSHSHSQPMNSQSLSLTPPSMSLTSPSMSMSLTSPTM